MKLNTDFSIAGNYFFSSELQVNANKELYKKQILPFLSRAFKNLASIQSITISKNNITYIQNNTKKELNSLSAAIFRHRVFRNQSVNSFTLRHDTVGEKIHKVAESLNMPKIYTSTSGGGGHKLIASSLIDKDIAQLLTNIQTITRNADERLTNPERLKQWCFEAGLIKEKDLLNDCLGPLGRWAINQWDCAHKSGSISKLQSLLNLKWLSEFLFGPSVFFATLQNLCSTKPKELVCTQPVCIPAMLFAILIYNTLFKPKHAPDLRLNLYITDMPTELSGHFFDSIRSLWEIGGKKNLILHSLRPKEGDTWQMLCNLPDNQVRILETNELPVRPAFLKAALSALESENNPTVKFKVSCDEEKAILLKTLHEQNSSEALLEQMENGVVDLSGSPADENIFLMLGSLPPEEAVRQYVDRFIELANTSPEKSYRLFAFAGKFIKENNCFYKTLSTYIQSKTNWPQNLTIIPLSFQGPDELISLMLGCDTITSSGGSTSMELLVLNQAQVEEKKQRYIHVHKQPGRSLEDSIILPWEKGNFLFLEDKINASLTTPEDFLI